MATRNVSGRGVGDQFDAAPGVQSGAADEETQEFLIQTSDGSVYRARASAEALALVMAGLTSERFVRLGDTVVRCDDVRAVYVSEGSMSRSFEPGRNRGSSMSTTMEQGRGYDGGETTHRMAPMRSQRGWGGGLDETKSAGKTTELLALLLGVLGIAICTAVFDELNVWRGFILITALTGAYIVSRGIAKAGSSHRDHDSHRS
jgi:hypothetical protein